ncbi:MAG: outer membrane beta-barrel protein [Bacteroidota bacterium]
MKHLLTSLLLGVLLFAGTESLAQLRIGIKGGYSRVWQDYGPDVNLPEDARTHLHRSNLGLIIEKDLGSMFNLSLEPGLAQRGAACIPGFIDFIGDAELRVDYVEVPLMVSSEFFLIKDKLSISIRAGLNGAVALKAVQRQMFFNEDTPDQFVDVAIGNFGTVNRFDVGVQGGIQFRIPFGKQSILIGSDMYTSFMNAVNFTTSSNRDFRLYGGIVRTLGK